MFSSRVVLQDKVAQLKQEVESATTAIDQAENDLVALVKEVGLSTFVKQMKDKALQSTPP